MNSLVNPRLVTQISRFLNDGSDEEPKLRVYLNLDFEPELLSGRHHYARMFPDASGQLVEESDRYLQALLYKDVARSCFAETRRVIRRSVTE